MISDQLAIILQEPHVHLTRRAVWALFGEDMKLTPATPTDMPGKFIANERVRVIGPAGEIELPILGPSAPRNQVELTPALAATLGVEVKVELSGNGSGGNVILRGPAGEVELTKGVMLPQPHLHLPPEDASTLSLLDGQVVDMATADGRILSGVAVRVNHLTPNRVHLLAGENCPFTADDVFRIL